MESENIFQTLTIDSPEEHDQKRSFTLRQDHSGRLHEIHLSREAWEEVVVTIGG